MAISFRSQEFQDALDEISDLDTLEERQKLLEERGIDQKDFEDAYLEYEPIKDNVGRKVLEKYNVSNLDELTPDGREEFQIELENQITLGSDSPLSRFSRTITRVVGDTARGMVELGDTLADTTKTGQEITDVIAKKADEFSDEFIPESFSKAMSAVFDPYHGDSTAGDIEKMTGQIAGVLIPATGLVKGAQLGLKATAALSPAARATASRMGRRAKNTVGEKVSKVAGQSATAAQYGVGYAVAAPFFGDDINKKLDEVGIDRTGLSKQQKYLEYYKQQVPKDILQEGAFAAAIPLGIGAIGGTARFTGKMFSKLLGSDAIKRVSSIASNNVLSRFIRENFTSQRGVDDITFTAAVKRDNAAKAILKETDGLTQDLQRAVKKDKVLGKLSKENNFDYIINISEDGWFGNSIGPKQHFAHSIFRSIESGKYLIRSANNGISAIINPMGIVEQKVEFGSAGYVELSENKLVKSTPFKLYGNKIFLMLILIYIFLIFSFNRIKV